MARGPRGSKGSSSQRAPQDAGPDHEAVDVDHHHDHKERQRDRDRAGAPLALLLLGQDDGLSLLVHWAIRSASPAPYGAARPRRPPSPPSTRRTANSANR